MRYVAIDIETTGLDPDRCQVLEFAAVIDDLEQPLQALEKLPTFQRYLLHDHYYGEPYAIWLNQGYFEKRAKLGKGVSFDAWVVPDSLMLEFFAWLNANGVTEKINAAGKNFQGFDRKFLERLQHFNYRPWHHRATDPGPLYLLPGDPEPPSLQTCLERAGIKRQVQHTAVEDAQDVILLLRNHYDRLKL